MNRDDMERKNKIKQYERKKEGNECERDREKIKGGK